MISRKELKEGYKLYTDKKISNLVFAGKYLFNASNNDVIDIVAEAELIIENIIEEKYGKTADAQIIFATNQEIDIIEKLYEEYTTYTNREEIITDLLK